MLKLKKYTKPIAKAVGEDAYGDPQTKNISNKSIANAVGADASVRPHFEEPTLKTPKAYSNLISNLQPLTSKTGITLIALIITIIVMLILVGVTISVALNGGLFEKAQKATYQTGASEIQEQVEVEKAIIIAENNGNIPANYNIKIDNLDISEELKNKFRDKLIISNGTVFYDETVVTDLTEQSWLEEIGIYKFGENKPTEIHLGDRLENVTFKDLSEQELDDFTDLQMVIIKGDDGIIYEIVLAPDSGSGNSLTGEDFSMLTLTMFGDDCFGMYFYVFDPEFEPYSTYTYWEDTNWFYDKEENPNYGLDKCQYPINGEVFGLVDSNTMKYCFNPSYDPSVSGIIPELKLDDVGFTMDNNLAVNSDFFPVLDWEVIPKQ